MIYVLYSSTGSYDSYRETAEYYFTCKETADSVLEKLTDFDECLVSRLKHLDYWKYVRLYKAAYRKVGVAGYIDDGMGWFIKPVKCGDKLECLK